MRRDDSSDVPTGTAETAFFRDTNGASRLTIRLFGGMSIEDSRGAQFLPRSRKTRAVAAILILTAPRPVLRMQMTALLWSRREKEQARASLRQAVHELQEALGPAWSRILTAERHALSMDLRDVSVDALDTSGPVTSGMALLRLFQDGFLEELTGLDPSFDEWLAKERRRLMDRARMAGETMLREQGQGEQGQGEQGQGEQGQGEQGQGEQGQGEQGRGEQGRGGQGQRAAVAAVARSLLRIDPANNGAWRAVVQGMVDSGDLAAAKFACEQWREAAGVLPGQPPPPELTALQARIRAGPNEAAAAPPVPEPSAPRTRSSLRLGIREMRVIGAESDRTLAAGLAEEVTTALSRFRWISCVSGSSLAAIAGEAEEANLRWADIDLDMILDGTIQRAGPRVRITARLLDMRAGGEVLWANRFDRDAADTLSVQDEVAAMIVAQVDPVLLITEGERAAARNMPSCSPRDMVLRAVPAIYRLDRLSFRAAGELLEAALQVEPGNVDALAWYAYWHLFLVGQGWAGDPAIATARAALLADTAVTMDPNDARALTLAGHVRSFLMKRPSEATVLHDRAISLNPNLAIAWCFSGFALSYLGDHDMAIVRMRQAIQLSPSDPHLFFFQMAILMPHLLRGEYHEAVLAGREAVELNPWFSSSFKGYLSALGHLGQTKEAATVLGRLLKLEPAFTVRDAVRRSPMNLPADIERYAEGLRRAGLPEG